MKKTKNNPLPEERVDDGYVMRIENVNMVFHKPGSLLADRDIHVLKDVSLNIKKGEIIALIGESGCGKTTLGKIITGLYRPTSGEIGRAHV